MDPALQEKITRFLNFDLNSILAQSPITSPIEEPIAWKKGKDSTNMKSPELISEAEEHTKDDSEIKFENLEEYNPEQVILEGLITPPKDKEKFDMMEIESLKTQSLSQIPESNIIIKEIPHDIGHLRLKETFLTQYSKEIEEISKQIDVTSYQTFFQVN